MKRRIAASLAFSMLIGQVAAQDIDQFDLPPLDGQIVEPFPPLDDPALDAPPLDAPPLDAPSQDALPPLDPLQMTPPQAGDGTAAAVPPPPPERIKNRVAEFSGIDKITGRITSFDVYVDETVQFGALQVTPRVCYTSAPTEAPQTDSFVEVDEITLDREIRRIFTGWMFSDSPGLNAVEHPVYDVWLKSCKTDSTVPPPAG